VFAGVQAIKLSNEALDAVGALISDHAMPLFPAQK